jgi:pimeloyl-ACP methyl ester carboxylesterase
MILTIVAIGLSVLALLAAATAVGARMIARTYPPTGRFIDVVGGRLHVVELDRRERRDPADLPLVLIHGASGNLEEMRLALGDVLSPRHRVILVDRPGHGWSERIDADGASPARQAAMIAEGLDRLGVRRAVIVAHSLAATVATSLALDDPARVAGLVLTAPALYPWPGGVAWYYNTGGIPVLGPLFVWTITLPTGLALMKPMVAVVFSPQPAPADYADRAAIPLVLRPESFLANARDVAGLNAFVMKQSPRYGGIEAPTTIITGDRDTVVIPRIHAHALAAVLPHSKLVVLEGVGHMPHHVARERVVAEIEEMMAAVSARVE